jgi:integrase
MIPENPIAAVRAPRSLESKPHRFYEAEELQRLYEASARTVNGGEGPQPNPMYASIWKLYANTGMRRMEGLHLRWRDIGQDSLRILSSGEARTKSGKWREVPISDGAREALRALPRSDYILPRMAKESLSRAFLRDALIAGLDGSLHTLRHTYFLHSIRSGTPLRTVQLYVGHAHITTTEGYAYLAPGSAPEVVLRLDI